MVFGSLGEMSSNGRELIETAVEYEVEHLGRNMAATTVDTVKSALRRRYMTQLSLAERRGNANLLLDRTKYVGIGKTTANMAQIRMEMRDMGGMGGHRHLWMAHP